MAVVENQIDSLSVTMNRLGEQAQSASSEIAMLGSDQKNAALEAIADELLAHRDQLLSENAADLARAGKNALESALMDRLELNDARLESMADGLRQIATLPDPVGAMSSTTRQPNGLEIGKMRVPLGVIGIVYESRPNVTADAAALCLKSGNAVILRGGSEAIRSNQAIASCIQRGLKSVSIDQNVVQLVETTDREAVGLLLGMEAYVNVIIPRGGRGLVARIAKEAKVPVIKHLDGLCHVYIDSDADPDKAVQIAVNSKTYRFGICGAMETLLVNESIAGKVLPQICQEMQEKGVVLKGCDKSRSIVSGMEPANEVDWQTEYLSPMLSIRVVDSMETAMDHIGRYGSAHTDSIVTEHLGRAREFIRKVDSSSVMVNAATCFADGYQYGLGAEIGISTDKLHVRGPVGLEGLTTEKYVVIGEGTIRV